MTKIILNEIFGEYGNFTIGPLEKDFGITLGNLLRRTLLGNIKSLGILEIRFLNENKIIHEFTVLSGLKESFLEITENLNHLIFIDKDRSTLLRNKNLFLKLKGPKRITAKDFVLPEGILITKPDFYIGTINEQIEIEIYLTIGYEINRIKNTEKNSFRNFNSFNDPVERVNYKIEKVKKNNDYYEQIILEIWTNGSISPQDAIKNSINIIDRRVGLLKDSLNNF